MNSNPFQSLRRRQRLMTGLFLGYGPAVGAVALSEMAVAGTTRIPMPFAVAWLVGLLGSMLWLVAFRCPRCGNPFLVGWMNHPFAESCRHCGLDLRRESTSQ